MQLAVYMNLLQTERTLDVVGVIDDHTEYFQIVSEGTKFIMTFKTIFSRR